MEREGASSESLLPTQRPEPPSWYQRSRTYIWERIYYYYCLLDPEEEPTGTAYYVWITVLVLIGVVMGLTSVGILLFVIGEPTNDERELSAKPEAPSDYCSNGFPREFIWGLGTAAYQIEGGNTKSGRQPSIWDDFSHQPNKVYASPFAPASHGGSPDHGDTGDVACDHYHRFREDVDLMRAIGLKHYRFSISWSRVMSYDEKSNQMVPNEAGLKWYDDLLDALEEAGVTPYVTLYHWDLPSAIHEHFGGWHTPDNALVIEEFVKYATLCFERFGQRVGFWVTFNEPWSFALEGYDSGKSAPGCAPYEQERPTGRCKHGGTVVYIVAHNVLNAHAAAAKAFHEVYQPKNGGTISITLNCEFSFALNGTDTADVKAAERANEFMLGWWLQPLLTGDYPKVMREFVGERLPTFTEEQSQLLIGSIDVLALNHYSSHLVSEADDEWLARGGSGWCTWADDMRLISTVSPDWPVGESVWEHAYAPGMRALLNWAAGPESKYWPGKPVYITENGWSCHSMTAEDGKDDWQQVDYFASYIEQIRLAMVEDMVNVTGYFGWSLLDNYEWSDGYSKRFGLFFVDYETQKRTPKKAALWWNESRRCEL